MDPARDHPASRDREDAPDSLLHDVRTSLTVIIGNAQLLERWTRDNDGERHAYALCRVGRIEDAARQLRIRLERRGCQGEDLADRP